MKQLSNKNPFAISKHRYYELKHYCMQYQDWIKELKDISLAGTEHQGVYVVGQITDPTANAGLRYYKLKSKIHLVEQACTRTDEFLAGYLFKGVTQGLSFDAMNAQVRVPCCREKYYYVYRKFFKILDELKQ